MNIRNLGKYSVLLILFCSVNGQGFLLEGQLSKYVINIADLDGDNVYELLTSDHFEFKDTVWVFDGESHELKWTLSGVSTLPKVYRDVYSYYSIGVSQNPNLEYPFIYDYNADGSNDIFLWKNQGCIILDLVGNSTIFEINEGTELFPFLIDVDNDDILELILTRPFPPTTYVYSTGVPALSHSDSGSDLTQEYTIGQNYPNPFNPSTIIDYQLAKPGNVKLNVYDVRGRLVDTLVDRFESPGKHSAIWKPDRASSGMYFYQIEVDGVPVSTKKAVLLK